MCGIYITDHPEALEACSERVELGETLNRSCFDKPVLSKPLTLRQAQGERIWSFLGNSPYPFKS
ncbi:MAG: hypothetical protein Q8N70_11825, partial [Deltaproteobacteria bacterium]|nr:hypothetical protein [Deltaproteobacteria bacterium]